MKNNTKCCIENMRKVQQERDELAALVEVMRNALRLADKAIPTPPRNGANVEAISAVMDALSIPPSAALREIQARTLEEAAYWFECQAYRETMWSASRASAELREMAEAKRKGEE